MTDHNVSRRMALSSVHRRTTDQSQAARLQAELQARRGRVKVLSRAESQTSQYQRLLVLGTAAMLAAVSLLYVTQSRAAGGSVHLETPRIDQGNEKSLQRGAKAFVNYCMGCHTAGYQRYSRFAQDAGLSEADVSENLIFTTDTEGKPTKVGSLMGNNMTKEFGKLAFGVAPPNLALTARSRGVDWVYTYLKSYYLDPSKTTGVNNLVFPDTAMPNILWSLQGLQVPIYGEEEHGVKPIVGLEVAEEGQLSEHEFDNLVKDITNFMAYMSDPIKETRHTVGMWVMLFLFLLLIITYFLKKEYWKDVIK